MKLLRWLYSRPTPEVGDFAVTLRMPETGRVLGIEGEGCAWFQPGEYEDGHWTPSGEAVTIPLKELARVEPPAT